MEERSKRQKKEFVCRYCDKEYKKPSKLIEHEMSHTGERPFACKYPDCNKAYRRSAHLNVHLKSHKNIKDHLCSFENCSAAFSTKQHLQRHEKQHIAPLIECDFPGCIQVFTKRFQLRWHKASHVQNSLVCECGSTFPTLPALEKHRNRVHDNPVIYQCGKCELVFKKWSELRSHVAKDHPIVCNICEKTYTKQYNLRQHIKNKHTDNSIRCDWPSCESILQSKQSYKMHVALVHEQDIRFKCDQCEKGFPYKSMLERHRFFHEKPKSPVPPRRKVLSVAEKLSGYNHYDETYKLECPFTGCQYKFKTDYLLRKHLEGKIHAEDVKKFAANNPPTAA